MELKQLEYFLAVSNVQSFTRAAEQLYISQPSVTAAIKKLEDELGIMLFDRGKKQATLTSEGKIFYSHVCVIMRDISKAAQKAAELKNLSSGLIKIGISSLTSLPTVAFLLAKFHHIYPSLKFDFIEGNSQTLKKQLADDKIDLALLLDDATLSDVDYVPISQERLFAYLPMFHPLAGRDTISFKELRQELFLLPREDCAYRRVIEHFFSTQSFHAHISFETNYPQLIGNLIIAGSGISLLPQGAIENANLRAIPLKESPVLSLCIAKKQNRQIAHAANKLYDFFRESYTE